jgi:hypothetical protein
VRPDSESVRKAIAALLGSEQFNDVLSATYAEYGEQVSASQLPAVVYSSIRWQPQAFPCVEIGVVRKRRNHPESYALDADLIMVIFYHVQGADEERLQTEVERFCSSCEDYFISRPNLTQMGLAASLWTGDTDYSPLVRWGDENAPLIKSGSLELFAKVIR